MKSDIDDKIWGSVNTNRNDGTFFKNELSPQKKYSEIGSTFRTLSNIYSGTFFPKIAVKSLQKRPTINVWRSSFRICSFGKFIKLSGKGFSSHCNELWSTFRTQSNIYNGAFKSLTIFRKELHSRCLTGFYIRLWRLYLAMK